MAGLISTGSHPAALWPGVKAWFGRQYNEHTVEYTDLFDMDTSSMHHEEEVQVTGFGLAPIKPEGQGVSYDSESQGFTKRYTHVTYALGYIVTREELSDNLYPVVSKRRAQANAFSMRQTKENVAANVYNRCVTATYNGGDGVVLLSASHTSKAGLWSNILAPAADLSEVSLEDLCIQIMGMTNDRGLKISLMPRSLHVHRNEWFNANRILKSALQSNTANNDINALKVTNAIPEGIKVNHYFTDVDAFFLRTNAPRGMIGFQRWPMEFSQDNYFDTENAKAKSVERYVFGHTDPRGLAGSIGA